MPEQVDVEARARARKSALLVLVRHAESDRIAAKRGNRFFLDDEMRRSVRGIADHKTGLTVRG
jgi:hypothetical protein